MNRVGDYDEIQVRLKAQREERNWEYFQRLMNFLRGKVAINSSGKIDY
jgi:hypothetical protein